MNKHEAQPHEEWRILVVLAIVPVEKIPKIIHWKKWQIHMYMHTKRCTL